MPAVHLNVALGANGSITGRISSDADLARVHSIRALYDAVAVGAGTFELDRPRLTARSDYLAEPALHQPLRVVFGGRTPVHDHFPSMSPLIVVGGVQPAVADAWLPIPPRDAPAALHALGAFGIRRLLVEGGPTLWCELNRARLVDLVTAFVATTDAAVCARVVRQALGLPLSAGLRLRAFGGGTLATSVLNPRRAMMLRAHPGERDA